MNKQRWFDDLTTKISHECVKIDELLSLHTMTKMGGRADLFVSPTTEEETIFVVSYAHDNQVPLLLLGNGSNMVVRDGGVRGIVLNLSKLNRIIIKGTRVYAESGADIIDVSRAAVKETLAGLEFACGIPGSVGGAMAMNAGAYGGEIKDIIFRATVLTQEGEKLVLSKEELELEYRMSVITKKDYFVLSAEFDLIPGDQLTIDAKVADLTHLRETKQPLEYPSAGSVFKRPPGYFAGKLIQDCELQGKGFGGAEVSMKHAGFIVNKNNATATDYIQTIEMVREKVQEKFGILLDLEVKIVGENE
jgi:UDP-N-acetylmuramate dehydrogenase